MTPAPTLFTPVRPGARSRRSLIRTAALAAGGLLGAQVPALGTAAARAAAPTGTGAPIRLTIAVAYQGAGNFQGTEQQIVDDYIAAHWSPAHPGVRVSTIAGMSCNGSCLSSSAEIAASLAGEGADIVTGCCNDWYNYLAADLMRPIDAFVKQDNVDLSVFSPGHLAALTTPGGLLALPEYDGPMVLAANLGMLDARGLRYPEPGWTYDQAATLWRSLSGTHGSSRVYGASLYAWQAGSNDWWPAAWGGATGSGDGVRCLLDSPQSTAAFDWFVELYRQNAVTSTANPWTGTDNIYAGITAFNMSGGWNIQSDLLNMRGMKWDYFEMPRFPAGQRTYVNNDFYAMNAYSRNPPEIVWEMMKFLVLDRGFAHLQFKTTFVTPNQTALWGDWIDIVRQAAPPLRAKNLEAYAGAAAYDVAQYFFKYSYSETSNVQNQYTGQMIAGTTSPRLALQEITGRINAIESAGAALSAENAAQARSAHAQIAAVDAGHAASFSAPARVGLGQPFTPAPGLVARAGGTFTLTGGGAGLAGSTADGTFACAAATAPRQTYTVRLTAFSNVDEHKMDQGAKAGVMLRANLSDDCPCAALVVSGQEGAIFSTQDVAEVGADHAKMGNGAALMLPLSAARGRSFLRSPVWLRLVREVDLFSAFISGDGTKWSVVGGPVRVPLAGAWVGLFATAHESGKRVRASFDHIAGFSPSMFVSLGTGE